MATQLFSQTLPQSTPATPTRAHFLLSSMQKQPVANSTHPHSLSTQQKNTHITPLLQNVSTIGRNSVTTPLPITAPSLPPTTVMSQIPTSLQRLVQANLSATPCTVQQPLPSSHGPSASSSSSSSSPTSASTTAPKSSPVPLSIPCTTSLNGKQSDDIGPTPLTPLSPYCGQQGISGFCVVGLECTFCI